MAGKKDSNDFNLDSIFDENATLDDIFVEEKPAQKKGNAAPAVTDDFSDDDFGVQTDSSVDADLVDDFPEDDEFTAEAPRTPVRSTTPVPQQKRRSFLDFEPDMDALLLTAQSSMIIEGIITYSQKNFKAKSLNVYNEAQKGVELYMKILNRRPENYHKLKKLIDADTECQQVEKTAFNLFHRIYKEDPETDSQKLEAFEMLQRLFMEAVEKASISKSMQDIREYFLLTGGLDEIKVRTLIDSHDLDFRALTNRLHVQVKSAQDMIKKGKFELTEGLRGRDINIFLIKASQLLNYYHTRTGNADLASFYARINELYKKYFVIRD